MNESTAVTIGVALGAAVLAVSTRMIMVTTRRLSLMQGAVAGTGGAMAAILGADVPFALSAGAGVLTGAALGVAAGGICVAAGRTATPIVTYLIGVATELSFLPWLVARGSGGGVEVRRPRVFGDSLASTNVYVLMMLAVVAVIVVLDIATTRSLPGLRARAAASNPRAANAAGVGWWALLPPWAVAGATAGLGGVLLVHLLHFVDAGTFTYVTTSLPAAVVVALAGTRGPVVVAGLAALLMAAPQLLPGARGWTLVMASGALLLLISRAHVSRSRREELGALTATHEVELPVRTSGPGTPVEVRDLIVRKGGKTILDRVSLRAGPGVTGLIGDNGAGKTTLLDAICGFTGDSGRISIGDRSIESASVRKRANMGIVRTFDEVALFSDLSAEEHLLLASCRNRSHARRGRRAESKRAATLLGIEPSARPSELSYADRRLLEAACALASGARVLLLDEPTAGTPQPVRQAIAQAVRRAGSSATIVIVEHDLQVLTMSADRLFRLSNGALLETSDQAVGR